MTDVPNPVPKHEGDRLPVALETLPQTPDSLLLGYQLRVAQMLRKERVLVVEKSRRIGLTWAVAAYAVLRASASRVARGTDFLYISYKQEIAREFVDACGMWARAFAGAAAEVGEYMFDDVDPDSPGETRQIKAFRISFASGKKIIALSSAPRSLRGMQGAVCIDEAAFVDNLHELLKAAMAFLIWGGQVIVISTHNGVDNPFNELLDAIRTGKRKGATLRIPLADAMADGFYERICLVNGNTPSAEDKVVFEADIRAYYGEDAEEELDCVPAAGAGSLIPPELVVAAEHPDAGKPELYGNGGCFGGRDISAGRGGDNAAMWVFEMVGNVLWQREHREGRNIGLVEQEEIFNGQFKRFRILRYGVDQTGLGEGEVARAQLKFGSVVEGFILTPAVRLAAANAMKRRYEEGTIRTSADPKYAPLVRADFRAIKKKKGVGNTVRLVNEGDVHADMFWACALACLVADGDVLVYTGYQGAPPTRGKFDEGGNYEAGNSFHMHADEEDIRPRRFGIGTY